MTDAQTGNNPRKPGRPLGSTNRKDVSVAAQVRARRGVLVANRQEDLRERIRGAELLNRLERIQLQLSDVHGVELDAVQVQRLGRSADIALRILGKCLPDLKSVEVVKRTEEVITIDQVSSAERDQINDAISRALGIVENGGGGGEEEICSQKYITPSPRQSVLENDLSEGDYREAEGDAVYDSSS